MTLTIKPRPDRRRAPEDFPLPARWVQVGRDPEEDPVTVYIPQRVLEEIWRHACGHPNLEVGGYLFGQAYAERERAVADVHGVYRIISTDATVAHFRFKVEDSLQAEQFQQAHFPGTEIVGWFHTHPGHGVFMSSTDVATHVRYFSPFHRVAMVIDPLRHRFAAFAHRDGVVYSLRSVRVVLSEGAPAPVVVPAELPRGAPPNDLVRVVPSDATRPSEPAAALPVGQVPLGPAEPETSLAPPNARFWSRLLRRGPSIVPRLLRTLSAWARLTRSPSAPRPEPLGPLERPSSAVGGGE